MDVDVTLRGTSMTMNLQAKIGLLTTLPQALGILRPSGPGNHIHLIPSVPLRA
jgi:hypothetical protein